jgi:hypothetical protein
MRKVILESPFAGFKKRNKMYARLAGYDCLRRGESPFASHLLFTQMLDDDNSAERMLGIQAGFAWRAVADYTVFYCDFGFSNGMRQALSAVRKGNLLHQFRTLWTPLEQVAVPRIEDESTSR